MKKNRIYFIIIGLIILNCYSLVKLERLETNLDNIIHQVDYTENNLRNEINTIYSNVDEKLKKQGSILDSHQLTLGKLNEDDVTVPITLRITPKEASQNLGASLEFNDKIITMKKEGTSFVATFDSYVFDKPEMKVILENNGVQKIETLNEPINLRNKYLLDIFGSIEGSSSYGSGLFQHKGTISFNFSNTEYNSPKKITVIKEMNKKIISQNTEEASYHNSMPFNEKYKLNKGDKLDIYAIVEDQYGFNYKYNLLNYEIGSNGNPISDGYGFPEQRVVEIRDKSGKIIYEPKNDFIK